MSKKPLLSFLSPLSLFFHDKVLSAECSAMPNSGNWCGRIKVQEIASPIGPLFRQLEGTASTFGKCFLHQGSLLFMAFIPMILKKTPN